MNNLLCTIPSSRVRDSFAHGEYYDFSLPAKSEKDPIIQGNPNTDFRFDAHFYKKIGVDIVTETVYDYPYCFITEKTYRSIASLRPFIIVGAYKTLDFLKHFEFQTFSSIIDETYDTIKDPNLRFRSVCNSIMQFVDRPIQDIKDDILKVEKILLHNQYILKQLKTNEINNILDQIENDRN